MAKITDINGLTHQDWRDIVAKHLYWSKQANRFHGDPKWDEGGLQIIGVRMNAIENFYVRGKEAFNDFLVLILNQKVHVFACTTDPAHVDVNPRGVAHLCEGSWDSYVRGAHKAPWRRALVQRAGPVRVVRTNQAGKVLMQETGYFGINIHNAAGFNKPSAGCTVLKPAGVLGVGDRNFKEFKETLQSAPDRKSRTYFLMNRSQLESYGYTIEVK